MKGIAKVKETFRAKMSEQAASFRKRFANLREKASSPKALIGMVLVGLLAGALLPRAVGNLDRSKRRYVRLGVGVLLLALGWKRRSPLLYLGAGVLASEVLFTGVEYVGPKMGLTVPEIGELPEGRSAAGLLAARESVFGQGSERVYPELSPAPLTV